MALIPLLSGAFLLGLLSPLIGADRVPLIGYVLAVVGLVGVVYGGWVIGYYRPRR